MSQTAATRYLNALVEHGIEYFFVNAGTDFAPIVEAYALNKDNNPALPTPVLCAHENLAGGMAHGAALVTGRPQALMLHVNVGTANAACSVANASRGGRRSSKVARSALAICPSTGRRRCSTRRVWCANSSSGTTNCAIPVRSSPSSIAP
ncbi:thiamine pyrophosphate-binding protein [Mycobacteriaceae bacterium Msp059]|nr:thiamine pyrophosphate-binding protein [Mycobacteriaceae bacterium Msp059]